MAKQTRLGKKDLPAPVGPVRPGSSTYRLLELLAAAMARQLNSAPRPDPHPPTKRIEPR